MASLNRRIEHVARESFGWEKLRPGQAEAATAVVEGRDTLAVMSTGYGKSAIYQIAAVLIPGPTVVVSPLIALQREQAEELEDDELEFIFMSPEQLANESVQEELRAAQPSLFVVDEAHSISEWGHDFRPDYLKLGAVAEAVGRPPILALTATASPPVREEIVTRLDMRDPALFVRGFDRPNIWLGVERFHEEEHKKRALIERVVDEPKPGIVYAATRRGAEQYAEELRGAGVDALAYHGGMN